MTTDQTPLEGPTNGQRRVDQEEEGDGCENGEAIPKLRILSTLTVETGSRVATNTASQSWKPAFPHSFRNHDSILSWAWYDVTAITNSPGGVRHLSELSGKISSHNIFEFNIFNPYRSAVHSMVEEYDSARDTIEDWKVWNTNLLNFLFSKLI